MADQSPKSSARLSLAILRNASKTMLFKIASASGLSVPSGCCQTANRPERPNKPRHREPWVIAFHGVHFEPPNLIMSRNVPYDVPRRQALAVHDFQGIDAALGKGHG